MEEVKMETNRVRMNFSTTSKGFAQMDITVEFPTVEESKNAMNEAIKALRSVLKENNIKEAGSDEQERLMKETTTTTQTLDTIKSDDGMFGYEGLAHQELTEERINQMREEVKKYEASAESVIF